MHGILSTGQREKVMKINQNLGVIQSVQGLTIGATRVIVQTKDFVVTFSGVKRGVDSLSLYTEQSFTGNLTEKASTFLLSATIEEVEFDGNVIRLKTNKGNVCLMFSNRAKFVAESI